MLMSRRGSAPVAPDTKTDPGSVSLARSTGRVVFGTLIAASISLTAAQAATFGHSRIVSAMGQPLHLEIPVTQLTQQEIDSLRAVPAPAEAWREAGMTPPVALESMRLVLLDGYRPDVKVIQLRSDQAFDQAIVDVLLDVRSVSGQQRYQVSLLAQADSHGVVRASEEARRPRAIDGRGAAAQPEHDAAGRQIQVRAGDNMFAIARRNAVQGVTVYQMMIALQRANQQAFIEDNVNLVKAGATLTMPGMESLTALSDREARRIFQQHAQAFARYGQRGSAADAAALSTVESAAQGNVSDAASISGDAAPETSAGGDRLRLSGGAGEGATAQGGTQAGAAGGAGQAATDSAAGNLLASSGAIASDALSDGVPVAVAGDASAGNGQAFGSDAANGGTVLDAGNGTTHPDDQAAAQKGVEESRTRVLELEDNVRHLNEALQKQGHVAAEAAMEGARSVSEAIKEVIGIVDPDEAAAPGGAAAGTTGETTAADTQASAAGATPPAGTASSATPSDPAQGGAALSSGAAAATGSASSAFGGADSAANRAGQAAAPSESVSSSVRTDKKVSWLQENLLAVIGGGLAFIVLLVVWLLRRASAAKRDIFESDSPITDSMVRDRLGEIDLDLDTPPSGGRGRNT